ncbi:hypothetical protein SBADM41S_12174 [Streptomyces badius]
MDARVGHPWSVAAAAPYRLTTGRAPAAPGDVVVTTGSGGPRLRTGDRVRVRTPAGGETRTVVGTVAGRGFEDAVFFTDDEAARISPAIDALVVHADAAAVREALGPDSGTDVLTGHDRRRADPDPDRDGRALVSVNALLGTAAGITLFVSAAVVASTFSYAVAQRRREFGLLRTAGATPGQIRRTVLAESVLIGVAASAAGTLFGATGAPLLVRRMTEAGLAPSWFALGDPPWPLHAAFWAGVAVATAAALVSCHRAGRTAPTEALREAAVDSRVMPVSRWVAAVLVLLLGLGLPALALATDPGDLLGRKSYVTRPMLLIVGCALLAPVLVCPVGRLLTWLPARLPGATGVLVRENTAAGVRRTAAVATPVLITVALAASLTGTVATLEEARATEARTATTADFVVTSEQDGRPLATALLERVRDIDGAVVSASRSTAVTVLEEDTALVSSKARAVDPPRLADVAKPPVTAGRLADLDDGSIVVNEEWLTTRVGDRVTVWLGDGSERSLRIAAVLATGTGDNGVYVTARNAGGAEIDRIDVKVAPGGDRRASPPRRTPPLPTPVRGWRPPRSGRPRPVRGRIPAPLTIRPRPPSARTTHAHRSAHDPRHRSARHRDSPGQHPGDGHLPPGARPRRAPTRRGHRPAGPAARRGRGGGGGRGGRGARGPGRRGEPAGRVGRAGAAGRHDRRRGALGNARPRRRGRRAPGRQLHHPAGPVRAAGPGRSSWRAPPSRGRSARGRARGRPVEGLGSPMGSRPERLPNPTTPAGREGLDAVLARPDRAVVALDFDGTLADIVPDPEQARAHPGTVAALAALAPKVAAIAVITGRPAGVAVRYGGFAGVPGLERLVVLGHYGAERWDAVTGTVRAPAPHPGITAVRAELPGRTPRRRGLERHLDRGEGEGPRRPHPAGATRRRPSSRCAGPSASWPPSTG